MTFGCEKERELWRDRPLANIYIQCQNKDASRSRSPLAASFSSQKQTHDSNHFKSNKVVTEGMALEIFRGFLGLFFIAALENYACAGTHYSIPIRMINIIGE